MSGGDDGGTTILETPPYVIALVFFFFLVVSLGFEKVSTTARAARAAQPGLSCCIQQWSPRGLHKGDAWMQVLHFVKQALQKRGKQGLVSAMNNMQSELMCLGIATLILLLFESSITSHCSEPFLSVFAGAFDFELLSQQPELALKVVRDGLH